MKLSDFYELLDVERKEIELVKTWLKEQMNVEAIRDATFEEQTQNHIDFHGCLYDKDDTFEVKIRSSDYGDLLIETLSNVEHQIPGWISTSLAKYLVYAVVEEKRLIKVMLLVMRKLREWWLREGQYMNYPKHYGKTGGLYQTENRAVPLNALPQGVIQINWKAEQS